jgi:tetratricopeptide (TPR) repeat protein
MAAVDPYAPCPCGSGQKFKWCCHKVEEYVAKSQRLLEGNQVDAALAALDEGLRKVPGNAWLSVRKALILVRRGKSAEARPLLETVIRAQPDHVGAQGLLARVLLEVEGPEAGVAQLQRALADAPADRRPALATAAQLVGVVLTELGHVPAARKHMELALALAGGDADDETSATILNALRMLESNPAVAPYLRNPDALAPAPEGLDDSRRGRFAQALDRADAGLWADAAAAFEALAADGVAEAGRNAGLCRMWLLDDRAAAVALRQYARARGETPEAVDGEALAQLITPLTDADTVDQVHLIWTLRDRNLLEAALRASDRAHFVESGPLDPEDPKSFEVDTFELLDRPKPTGPLPERVADLPRVKARVHVGREIVILEVLDDGRMEAISAEFADLAGAAIPPAQPKTKEIGKLPRASVALRTEWWAPDDITPEEAQARNRQERQRILQEVWPVTPQPFLGGRTPEAAAAAGDARVPLRAALCQLELSDPLGTGEVDFTALRRRLNLPEEPPVDPATADVRTLHLARLHHVPADRLDDEQLEILYARARRYGMLAAMEAAARAVVGRPDLLAHPAIGHVPPYSDLANIALARGTPDEAQEWLRRGREADPLGRTKNAVRWDLLDVRLRTRYEEPEQWVPALAVVLDRHREDRAASPVVLTSLVEMGLVEMVPHPENPEQMLLDSRPLMALLAEYGPRITTASGSLGVAATQPTIWTPGAAAGGGGSTTGGGLWTPGSGEPGGGEKKLIIPGR